MSVEIVKDKEYKTHYCKRAHKTRAKANQAIREMAKKPGHKGRLTAYLCPVCGEWHVGRVNKNGRGNS